MKDSLPVGHHPGKSGREVQLDAVIRFHCVDVCLSRLAQQIRHLRGPGIDGQRPRLDLCHVDQVVDQVTHLVGLLVDYP